MLLTILIGLLAPRPQTFLNASQHYHVTAPHDWQSIPRVGGTQFVDSAGRSHLEVLVYRDGEMNPSYLFSNTLSERLRESYHEAYQADEAAIGIRAEFVADDKAQCVTYHPTDRALHDLNNLSGSKLVGNTLNDCYVYKNNLTYVLRTDDLARLSIVRIN